MPLHCPFWHFFPACVVGAAVVGRVVGDAVVFAVVVVIIGVVVVIIMDAKVVLRQLVELQQSTEQFV